MIFIVNLHVIAKFWFCIGASRYSNNNDGEEEDASGIYNEQILFKCV